MKNAASHGADMVEFDVQVNHSAQFQRKIVGKAYALFEIEDKENV